MNKNKYIDFLENFPFIVVGCIIEKNNRILLVRENKIEKGKWNQPAGWLDKKEDPVKGAEREIREETGLKIKVNYLLGIYNLIKERVISRPGEKIQDVHCIKLIFRAKIIGGKAKFNKKEIAEVKFFKPQEIFKMTNKELRDLDIKQEIKDYLKGKKIPLSAIHHTRYRAQY